MVTKRSSAASILDWEKFEIFFGQPECAEKYAAPIAILQELEIDFVQGEKCDSCSVAAKKLLASETQARQTALISSYAVPLLEECGNFRKGDLRVAGETDPVRFVTTFVNCRLPEDVVASIKTQLLMSKSDHQLLQALESRDGFVAYKKPSADQGTAKK